MNDEEFIRKITWDVLHDSETIILGDVQFELLTDISSSGKKKKKEKRNSFTHRAKSYFTDNTNMILFGTRF